MRSFDRIRVFMASESGLSKLWLGLAVAGIAFVLYSWLPSDYLVLWPLIPMHAGIMVLGFALFLVMGWRNLKALFGRPVNVTRARMPSLYWPCLAISFVYFIAIFFGYGPKYPSSGPPAPNEVHLRIFGSFYLFMSLASFGLSHLVGRRVPHETAA